MNGQSRGAGKPGLHCWSARPSPKSGPGAEALSARSQAKDVGLKGSSAQQLSVIAQPFFTEGAGFEGTWETGGWTLASCDPLTWLDTLLRASKRLSAVGLLFTEPQLTYL